MKFIDEFNISEEDKICNRIIEDLNLLENISEGEQSKSIQCDIARDNVKYYRDALFKIKSGIKNCKKIKNQSERFHCNNSLNDLLQQIHDEMDNQMDIISKTCMSHRVLRSIGRGLGKLGSIISKALDD